jgi:hypothetical protein
VFVVLDVSFIVHNKWLKLEILYNISQTGAAGSPRHYCLGIYPHLFCCSVQGSQILYHGALVLDIKDAYAFLSLTMPQNMTPGRMTRS